MRFIKYDKLKNMMANIMEEGGKNVLVFIEKEKDAIKRFQLRNLYYRALDKISKGRK